MACVWNFNDGCCGGDIPPDDPCNPGTGLSPYIWFDHDFDGAFEDGPYAMTYDSAQAIWLYNLLKTGSGADPAVCTDASFASGTLSMWITMNLGTTTTRFLSVRQWVCCDTSSGPPYFAKIARGVFTTPTWVGQGTSGIPFVFPSNVCTPSNPGYLTTVNQSFTDPCNNRVLIRTALAGSIPSIVITRGSASSGP